MLYFTFPLYGQHRHPFWANWCNWEVLATVILAESPLKYTSISACTVAFHSIDLKLQKRGIRTMVILVTKGEQPYFNPFKDIRTLFLAHAYYLMFYSTSLRW